MFAVPESYDVHEAVHHVEHTHHALEEHGEGRLRFIPLAAAIMAICAGLSSLFAGRLGEDVLSLKNEALLHEVSASDLWNEYQAESLKAHLYEINVITASGKAAAGFRAQAKTYRNEQPPLRRQARQEEQARDVALSASTAIEIRKSNLEVALAFFEVAIVLTSIAAMIKRFSLFALAALVGFIGIFFGLRGTLGF
jgi:hypothetical protein